MKVALLGAGKTGSKVHELHENTVIFNSKNNPTLEKLSDCDLVISFLAGDVFIEYLDLLVESKLPVVTGSTGFQWPDNFDQKLKDKKLQWIKAHNFSLGMNLIKAMIENLAKASLLYPEAKFSIHDIHHINKKDAPSGTALTWQDWLGSEANITAEREGDVIGYHHMNMDSHFEKIKITHEAKDRALFANGALWAAKQIFQNNIKEYGLLNFEDIVKKIIKI